MIPGKKKSRRKVETMGRIRRILYDIKDAIGTTLNILSFGLVYKRGIIGYRNIAGL